MGNLPCFSVQLVEGKRKKSQPQGTIGLLVNPFDPAGRNAFGITGAMSISHELLLLEAEDVEPGVLSSHPQHASPVLIYREDRVAVETIRVGLIVLKPKCETSCLAIKVIEAQARGHP